MSAIAIKGWGMCGSRPDAYSAELAAEEHEGKPVVRMWRSAEGGDGFGAMYQVFRADAYRRRRVRFSAVMRTEDVAGRAALCFRVDGADTARTERPLAFDNMDAGPTISGTTDWSRRSCVLDVAPEATGIFISNILLGRGAMFWSDTRFEIVDDSVPVTDMLGQNQLPDASGPTNLDFSEVQ